MPHPGWSRRRFWRSSAVQEAAPVRLGRIRYQRITGSRLATFGVGRGHVRLLRQLLPSPAVLAVGGARREGQAALEDVPTIEIGEEAAVSGLGLDISDVD